MKHRLGLRQKGRSRKEEKGVKISRIPIQEIKKREAYLRNRQLFFLAVSSATLGDLFPSL